MLWSKAEKPGESRGGRVQPGRRIGLAARVLEAMSGGQRW